MNHGRRRKSFKNMGDQMKEANGLIGMVKYAAEQSGSKYVIGRETIFLKCFYYFYVLVHIFHNLLFFWVKYYYVKPKFKKLIQFSFNVIYVL